MGSVTFMVTFINVRSLNPFLQARHRPSKHSYKLGPPLSTSVQARPQPLNQSVRSRPAPQHLPVIGRVQFRSLHSFLKTTLIRNLCGVGVSYSNGRELSLDNTEAGVHQLRTIGPYRIEVAGLNQMTNLEFFSTSRPYPDHS